MGWQKSWVIDKPSSRNSCFCPHKTEPTNKNVGYRFRIPLFARGLLAFCSDWHCRKFTLLPFVWEEPMLAICDLWITAINLCAMCDTSQLRGWLRIHQSESWGCVSKNDDLEAFQQQPFGLIHICMNAVWTNFNALPSWRNLTAAGARYDHSILLPT